MEHTELNRIHSDLGYYLCLHRRDLSAKTNPNGAAPCGYLGCRPLPEGQDRDKEDIKGGLGIDLSPRGLADCRPSPTI